MDNFETPEQRLRKIQNELNTAKAQTVPADVEKTPEQAENAASETEIPVSDGENENEEPQTCETDAVNGKEPHNETESEVPAPQRPQKFISPKNENRRRNGVSAVLITLTAISAAIAIFSTCVAMVALRKAENQPKTSVEIKQSSDEPKHEEPTESDGSSKAAIQKILPSVVEIMTKKTSGSGGGSGVIMTSDGYILTNAHVIDSARAVEVRDNEDNYYHATVVGYDSESDVGVIKIEGTFTPAEFANSETVEVGDTVIAIGTPYDSALFQTATKGMVSAIRNSVEFKNLGITADVIQHDATINSGNSGGPLINLSGQVIGLNSLQIAGEFKNLGFALRINGVLNYAKQIIENGKIEKPMLGVTVKANADGGLWVGAVVKGGAAEQAGVLENDIIRAIDDVEVNDTDDLSAYLKTKRVGDTVELTVERNGEELKLKAVLKSSK